MGQIAEDMLDGSCCSICGSYFKHPKTDEDGEPVGILMHGYPVVCWECWDIALENDHIRATVETF